VTVFAIPDLLANVAAAIIFTVIGVVLFVVAFVLLDRLTPGSLWTELIEKRNTALAILIGAMSIGLSIIIAAAVH
jgi:uncharacterized membrane protein YjfL (UPF0719 family)